MRLVSFLKDGEARQGLVEGEGIIDLTARLGPERASLRRLLANGSEVRALIGRGLVDLSLQGLAHVAPVAPDAKVICVGLNYAAHKAETIRDPADRPMLFARWPETLIGHEAPLLMPRVSEMLDYAGELLAVIGAETGRYLPAEQAMDKVWGYACMNEGSVRDWQRHSSQVTAGKNFVGTGAVGPWLTSADEVPDIGSAELRLTLNGETMQSTTIADMIWSVAETIAYVTQWIPLHPGDVIATGTPAGVGSRRTPPVFLREGDVVEVSVTGLGTLRNRVEREPKTGVR